ncbi:S24 family peptidase [Vibrio splendidus]|uniref:S24 family peptidase n=1 Tax=Vibrio splendidus TaxID=29497 RepID=UPI003B977517
MVYRDKESVLPQATFPDAISWRLHDPYSKNQALIMVHRIEDFAGDGIYVFRFDGQLMVKRLQFTKSGLSVVSDNTTYEQWELSRNEMTTVDFEIIDEVVWSRRRV